MQSITIVGRLTRDPERRQTSDGKNLTSMTLAVRQKDGSTVYWCVSAYNNTGENCYRVLRKGRQIAANGEPLVKQTNGKTYFNLTASSVEWFSEPKEENMMGTPLAELEDIKSKDIPF